jgi:hypothetical protein
MTVQPWVDDEINTIALVAEMPSAEAAEMPGAEADEMLSVGGLLGAP